MSTEEKEFFLRKKVAVTKDEYIFDLKQSIAHWEKMADKEIKERIEKYMKKMNKEKAEYLSYAAKYKQELAKIEKENA